MKVAKLLLFPFAVLYDGITRSRNYLFDIGHKPSFSFDTNVVVVGNLNVGGSGKTPMVEYLIHLLKNRYGVVMLSRGYKRNSEGYRVATEADSASSIGDEPYQIFKKFGNEVKVVVGEDRVLAIPHILSEFPKTQVIVLDDAFQHRPVKPSLAVLLTEFSNPFYSDFLLPSGYLREARKGAMRSDIVVITKCPDEISMTQRKEMTQEVQHYAGLKPVFFSRIQYSEPRAMGNQPLINNKVVLVSGIANIESFVKYCRSRYTILKHFDYPDHHVYSKNDLQEIEKFCKNQPEPCSILTTEKDMVKLIAPVFKPFLDELPWFYLPIGHEFLQDGLKFDELVFRSIVKPAGTE